MKSKTLNHLIKSNVVWNSKQKVKESREVRFLTLRENVIVKSMLPWPLSKALYWKEKVPLSKSCKKHVE